MLDLILRFLLELMRALLIEELSLHVRKNAGRLLAAIRSHRRRRAQRRNGRKDLHSLRTAPRDEP